MRDYKSLSDDDLKREYDKIESAWDHWTDVRTENTQNGYPDAGLKSRIDDLESQMKAIQHEFYLREIIYY